MPKKKKLSQSKKNDFNNDPFNNLKGFVVSDQEKMKNPVNVPEPSGQEIIGSFADEMEMLGIRKLNKDKDIDGEDSDCLYTVAHGVDPVEEQTDEELFIAAMGDLTISFKDHIPEEGSAPVAMPKRMKQLKQGKLIPDASLDLHGLQCADVAEKLRHFLQNGQHHDWQTLLVITGKGLHSENGEPVLRNEAEMFLVGEGKKYVAEWGRASKQYGGEGALILFLRKNK